MFGRTVLSCRATFLALRSARTYTNVAYSSEDASVSVRMGFPVLSLPLPSRKETCDFVLRPYPQTVADVCATIRSEDRGIESLTFLTTAGNRISGSTPVGLVFQSDFDVQINDTKFRVQASPDIRLPSDALKSFEELRHSIHKLYSRYGVDEHQLAKELELRGQLEQLRSELTPLEKQYLSLAEKSDKHREMMVWGGLSWMCLQFGFLSYLVWGEYDWDIMEPVTYFVGYGTSILLFAYFILTRQDYGEQSGHERYFLGHLYRSARREKFDIDRYNQLKDAAVNLRRKLDKLHDPTQLNLPTPGYDRHY